MAGDGFWRVEYRLSAWQAIEREVQLGGDRLETGGILLGREDRDRRVVVVTVAGGPGEHAQREPDRFSRDLGLAQRLAAEAWSRDRSVWVGEWHTHPTGPPAPSHVDVTTYLRHLEDDDLGFDRFVALVIANPAAERPIERTWIAAKGRVVCVPHGITSVKLD